MKRYNDLNSYFKLLFGHRVHKIAIDAGLSCPNRDGTTSTNGCIYCNKQGSGNGLYVTGMSVKQQINNSMIKVAKRFKAKKFIAYFQSFSNTYAPIHQLKLLWDEALSVENIIGLAVATRPDCINGPVLDLLEQYSKKHLVWVEYGLQSAHNQTLETINRGHRVNSFKEAVKLTKKRGIKICAHVILGLPNETTELMLKTADFLSENSIDAVKLHLLCVIKNTAMEQLYKTGRYRCLEQSEYASIVCDFIERLRSNVIIQRLCSDPHPNELIAPLWATQKKHTLSLIHNLLETRNTWQGKCCEGMHSKIKKL